MPGTINYSSSRGCKATLCPLTSRYLNQASKVKTLTKTIKTQQQKIVRTLQTVELRCSFAHTFQSAQSAQFAMMVHPVPSSAVAVVASDALSGSG